MNIVIDATWIGGMYGTKVMHGGLRVTDEFLKRIGQFDEHSFFLTNTNYRQQNIEGLNRYAAEVIDSGNVMVKARNIRWLDDPRYTKWYSKISRYVPVPYLYPFLNNAFLNQTDVYYSPVDPIPGIIRRNKRIRKFFTALDLIPLVRPDLSSNFYEYTKKLYDSLTPDTNILAISESTKKDILKYRSDLKPDKIRVIPLAANKQKFYLIDKADEISTALKKYNLSGKKYFMTVNSMARYKNVEFIISNFFSLIKQHAINDLYLVVIGQNREVDYKEYVEKKYGHSEQILFLDYIDDNDLACLYNGTTAFLYMSHYEGFGLPILEAMQCGAPVICSNTSSMPEVAGSAAILIDPVDDVQFGNSLYELYNNEELRMRMKDQGLVQVSKFSWDKYAREVITAFKEM